MGRISREGCRFSLRPSRARPSPSRRHHRCRKGQDPGQGGNPSRPAASYLRRQAASGWPHPSGLQHPEGVDPPPCASPRRSWRTQVQSLEEVHSEDALEVEEEEDGAFSTCVCFLHMLYLFFTSFSFVDPLSTTRSHFVLSCSVASNAGAGRCVSAPSKP